MNAQIPIIVAFGAAVRDVRNSRGLSQEELGRMSGLSRVYISDVELGKRNVSLENIARIAGALETEASALLEIAEAECDETV